MGQYRYPPSLNQTRNEDGDETWQIVETATDGEITVTVFEDRDEALAKLEELRSADNPVEEAPPAPDGPVEAVAEDPATEGEPNGD